MRYAHPEIFWALFFVLPISTVCGAEPCFLPSWSRPVTSTTYVVERPTLVSESIVSESIPIRIGPPIRETILSYEMPTVLPTSSSVTTRIADLPVSDLVSLQPGPDLSVDHRSPREPDRTVVLRPPADEKALEPLPEPPKRDTSSSSRLAIPPPFPTILGQTGSSFSSELEEALSQPPPLPQGPVDPKVIPSKLVDRQGESAEVLAPNFPGDGFSERNFDKSDSPRRNVSGERYSLGDSPINGILLITTVISVMTLIYMIFIAIDYHRRWMQSLTSRNSVFASSWNGDGYGGPDDFEMYENSSYDGGFPDGSGLGRFGTIGYAGYGNDV